MARTKSHRGLYGQKTSRGDGIAHGNVMRESTQHLIGNPGGDGSGRTRLCPTCQEQVTVKANGELSSHRVGSSLRKSWLCRGEDEGSE